MKLNRIVKSCCLLLFITAYSFGQDANLVPADGALLASFETPFIKEAKATKVNEKPTIAVTSNAFPMVSSVKIEMITANKSEKVDLVFTQPTSDLTRVEILSPAGEIIFKFMLPPSNKSHILHLHNLNLENGSYDVNIQNDVISKTHLLHIEN